MFVYCCKLIVELTPTHHMFQSKLLLCPCVSSWADLDSMCVLICTVAGHSWSNYVEGVMCIFNRAMNGMSLARPAVDKRKEAIMAKCGGLGDICAAREVSSNFRGVSLVVLVSLLSFLPNDLAYVNYKMCCSSRRYRLPPVCHFEYRPYS